MVVRCVLVGDGSSDIMLQYVLRWLLNDLYPTVIFTIEYADFRAVDPPVKALSARVEKATELYACDLLFIHRDAEAFPLEVRVQEIGAALEQLPEPPSPRIMIIPIRMTEAWLLFDEAAIRQGANNPNGKVPLAIPQAGQLHTIADPKALLEQLLIQAANLNRRQRKKFRPRKQMHRVAELIEDFSALRVQNSFLHLENQLRALADTSLITDHDPTE